MLHKLIDQNDQALMKKVVHKIISTRLSYSYKFMQQNY